MASGKHKSIGQQLSSCKTMDGAIVVTKRWGVDWYNEQATLLRLLRQAIADNNKRDQDFYLTQLEAVNDKRHGAFPRVLDRIAERAKKGDEIPIGKP